MTSVSNVLAHLRTNLTGQLKTSAASRDLDPFKRGYAQGLEWAIHLVDETSRAQPPRTSNTDTKGPA